MVGTAIIKDFETGSFENIRITFSEGMSFEDIDRADEVVSCLVNIEKRSIRYDYGNKELARNLTMNEVLDIAVKAREMWMENPYLTIARFVLGDESCEMRTVSEKAGVYEMPDLWALHDIECKDMYKLIKTVSDKDILYASLLCEAINYAVRVVYCMEEQLLGYSACGIYVNIPLAEACSGEVIEKDKKLRKYFSPMVKKHLRTMKKCKKEAQEEFESADSSETVSDIILSYRMYKTKVLTRVKELSASLKGWELILSLADDSKILSLTDSMYLELDYYIGIIGNLFERPSHAKYITIRDLLCYASLPTLRDAIHRRGRAGSVNYKLHSKLPCPDYYDSRGKAYWKEG